MKTELNGTIRGVISAAGCVLLTVGIVGCFQPVGPPPGAPPPPTDTGVPSKPQQSVPADTAGEADSSLVEAGRRLLKDKNYIPMPVYSRAGSLGIIRLVEGGVGKLDDAVIVFKDGDVADSLLKMENGYVFFNVDKTGPVKVGDFELAKGECVLFSEGKFQKITMVVHDD